MLMWLPKPPELRMRVLVTHDGLLKKLLPYSGVDVRAVGGDDPRGRARATGRAGRALEADEGVGDLAPVGGHRDLHRHAVHRVRDGVHERRRVEPAQHLAVLAHAQDLIAVRDGDRAVVGLRGGTVGIVGAAVGRHLVAPAAVAVREPDVRVLDVDDRVGRGDGGGERQGRHRAAGRPQGAAAGPGGRVRGGHGRALSRAAPRSTFRLSTRAGCGDILDRLAWWPTGRISRRSSPPAGPSARRPTTASSARSPPGSIEPLLDAAGVRAGTPPARRRLRAGQSWPGPPPRAGPTPVGLDLAADMVALARRRHPGLRFLEGDAERLPFDAASFDAVAAGFLVHHLPASRARRRRVRPRARARRPRRRHGLGPAGAHAADRPRRRRDGRGGRRALARRARGPRAFGFAEPARVRRAAHRSRASRTSRCARSPSATARSRPPSCGTACSAAPSAPPGR